MKLALLHTRLSGYLTACLREFEQQANAKVLIYAWPNQPDAPFDSATCAVGEVLNRYEQSDQAILKQILAFHPIAVLVSGWRDQGYSRICRQLKARGIPVIAGCDTQWKGSVRQYVAGWTAPLHVQKIIDVLWVTGERQRYLAESLGYAGDRCWDGYYACDWHTFAQPTGQLTKQHGPYFLYVGRYAPEKGLDTLAAAYQAYRQQVENPWPLICAGAGPLRNMLVAAGAEDKGFVQPSALPELLQSASAFVLPSRFEPWGVAAQEAAAASLPLILSDACGSGVHLLRPYYNGFRFASSSIRELTAALKAMHSLSPQRRLTYGQASYELSKQYTPQLWSQTLLTGLQQLHSVNSSG